jgi:hypothetical protein
MAGPRAALECLAQWPPDVTINRSDHLANEEKDMAAVMGMNLSNAFQSTPLPLVQGAQQIAKLPVGLVKLFSSKGADPNFWNAVSKNGLKVALGTTNDEIIRLASGGPNPGLLVQGIKNVASMISWICVGNEPLGSWYGDKYYPYLSKAVRNLYDALQSANLKIGVTVPQNFEFMEVSYPPSAGAIKEKFQQTIHDTCEVMKFSGAPFMVNIYPFITRVQNRNDVPLDYCLFTAGENHWVHDGNYTYKNIFDAMIDALHVALEKIGYPDLEIVIGECGWPTAGDVDATPANARTFLQNMIDHCKSGQGTPRLPNRTIGCFAFEMYDEDLKDTGPGPFETHWGVCNGAGQPKFTLRW